MILVIGGAFQGKTDFAKKELNISEDKICNAFHLKMRKWLLSGKNPRDLTAQILEDKNIDAVICDEIGLGIVPVDRFERCWREETGRALCELAKAAEKVYRVQCAIPTCIKGAEI